MQRENQITDLLTKSLISTLQEVEEEC